MAAAEISRSLSRLTIGLPLQPRLPPSHNLSSSCFKVSRAFRKRHLSTSSSRLATSQEQIKAAPEIDFKNFKPPPIDPKNIDLRRIRVVPASPSYFSGQPQFTDDYLMLQGLLAKYQSLPTCPPNEAPRATWKTAEFYISSLEEPIKPTRYARLVAVLRRLNMILPRMMPEEVKTTLDRFKRSVDPMVNQSRPILVDEHGRARAVGRRKESSAVVWLVEGDGEVLINGKKLNAAFKRQHDRESVVWPLKATQRLDKYNIFGIVRGGGTTGQAEAMTLGVARALMAHEPEIKTYLRKAGVVVRDSRMVERKKPGKRKARKMPAWVKR